MKGDNENQAPVIRKLARCRHDCIKVFTNRTVQVKGMVKRYERTALRALVSIQFFGLETSDFTT